YKDRKKCPDMNRTTPKSGRQSLFYQDLASPIPSRRSGGKFSTPGQAAAVSALWRENFATPDLPPPPVFTLEDKLDVSPEMRDYSASPEVIKSDFSSRHRSTTPKGKSDSASKPLVGQQSPLVNSTWWSPSTATPPKSSGSGEQEDKGKGSPVEGVVQPGALLIVPAPREVARPEVKKSLVPVGGDLDREEWVTVYGFPAGDTNLVLREFEKCGVILDHVAGPGSSNWMHILYKNRWDAQKAMGKNGMELNGVLIIGVKPVDPIQSRALNDRRTNKMAAFMSSSTTSAAAAAAAGGGGGGGFNVSPYTKYLPSSGGSAVRQGSSGTMATPAKSIVSKVMDLMFGV
ncbi:hypothetical protein M569_05113, partial [Genlisea aurea]